MDKQKKKCSSKQHGELDSIKYCQECNVYMCNKCEKFHSELLQDHHLFNSDINIDEIFTGFCKEKKHKNELEYFCKSNNKLWCSSCISKIKSKGNGEHKDCDVCNIEDIKNEKKDKLKENIK